MDPVVVIGLVMAAGFWILTQLNVIWTKNALSTRVIKAGADTKQQAIDTLLSVEKRLDTQISRVDAFQHELQARFEELRSRLDAIEVPTAEDLCANVHIPTTEQFTAAARAAIFAELEEFEFPDPDYAAIAEAVGPKVTECVNMAIKQQQAIQAKALTAQLEQLGMSDVIAEGQDLVMSQLPAQAVAFRNLMTQKPTKKWIGENPIGAQLFEGTKLLFANLLEQQGMMSGLYPQGRPAAVPGPPAGGEYVRGLRER